MSVEHWWNDTDRGKATYSDTNLFRCRFVHNKSLGLGLGLNPDLRGVKARD